MRKIANKTKDTQELQKALDAVYSEFIRLSSSDQKGNVKCYTCGKFDHYKKMQCGHYISRRHISTRWFEKNTKVQCVSCNIFNQGNGPAFAQALIKEYGVDILDELEIKKNNICKMGRFEYELLIKEYKEKIEKLAA